MFSNVICIGDSYTNEHECYEAMGYDKKFRNLVEDMMPTYKEKEKWLKMNESSITFL